MLFVAILMLGFYLDCFSTQFRRKIISAVPDVIKTYPTVLWYF